MKPTEKSRFGIFFLLFTIVIYLGFSIYNLDLVIKSLIYFKDLFIQVIPTIILVILFMIVTDLFLSGNKVKKFISNLSGIKGWILFSFSGILSSGPIYVWYPFLANLKKKGIRTGFLIAFLYNRAIKIPQIPIMLMVFSLKYIFILFTLMLIGSIIQGLIVELLLKEKN